MSNEPLPPIQPGDIYVISYNENYYMVIERKLEGDRGWWMWNLSRNMRAWERAEVLLDTTLYQRVA